jgi:hypothetical protein
LKKSGYYKEADNKPNPLNPTNTENSSIPIEEHNSLISKSTNYLWTYTKDIALGFALFTTAVLGIGSVGAIVSSVAPNHHYMRYTEAAIPHNSPAYDNFVIQLGNHSNAKAQIELLIQQNLLNEEGKNHTIGSLSEVTPLMQAAYFYNAEATYDLIKAGADINYTTVSGNSILDVFKPTTNSTRQIEIFKLLMLNGLDWKANNMEILKTTASNKEWRQFWVDYLTKYEKSFLPTYGVILKSTVSNNDLAISKEINNLKE